jgi:phosphoserine phosphatase RsbU/P
MHDEPAGKLRCLEVWGGNQRVERLLFVPGLQISVSSRPLGSDDAGGDVYYASNCAAGRLTRLLLADVAGHGLVVADVAAALRDLMRKNIETPDHGRFVADMNRQFSESDNDGRFATALVASFFAPTRRLTLSNAGHPQPLIYRAVTGEWTYLNPQTPAVKVKTVSPSDLPLGILADVDYDEFSLRLDRGDAVLCYTDGLVEARKSDGEMLGNNGLRTIVSEVAPRPAESHAASRIVAAVQALHPDNVKHDDCTVVIYQATGVRLHLADQFAAPFRLLFKSAIDSVRIKAPQNRPPWSA